MNVTSTKDAEQSLGCQYCNAVIPLTRAGATALYMYCTYCTNCTHVRTLHCTPIFDIIFFSLPQKWSSLDYTNGFGNVD